MAPNFLAEAVRLSTEGMRLNYGGPFGAVIVRESKIVGRGFNRVIVDTDPTAHAEIAAIRDACRRLGVFHLEGCDLYSSSEPCPMCVGAAYWAHIRKIYYANTRVDAQSVGFDDEFIQNQLCLPDSSRRIPMIRVSFPGAADALREWSQKEDKVQY